MTFRIAYRPPSTARPLGHGLSESGARVSDVWHTLEQSELATALTASALGVSLGVARELYAMHHASSLLATARLRRWAVRPGGAGQRAPWAVRHTPVVHGWVIAHLAPMGQPRALATPSLHDRALYDDELLTARLVDLLRLSTQRASLLHGLASETDVVGGRLLEKALAAAAVVEVASGVRRPRRLPRVLGAARVVLAVELTMAARGIRRDQRAVPTALQSVLAGIERTLDRVEQQILAVG